jgi:hypothetical protein
MIHENRIHSYLQSVVLTKQVVLIHRPNSAIFGVVSQLFAKVGWFTGTIFQESFCWWFTSRHWWRLVTGKVVQYAGKKRKSNEVEYIYYMICTLDLYHIFSSLHPPFRLIPRFLKPTQNLNCTISVLCSWNPCKFLQVWKSYSRLATQSWK